MSNRQLTAVQVFNSLDRENRCNNCKVNKAIGDRQNDPFFPISSRIQLCYECYGRLSTVRFKMCAREHFHENLYHIKQMDEYAKYCPPTLHKKNTANQVSPQGRGTYNLITSIGKYENLKSALRNVVMPARETSPSPSRISIFHVPGAKKKKRRKQ